MSDLIRRDDALAVVLLGGSPVGMSNRIDALPAVTVGVKPLVWERGRSGDYSVQETYDQGPKPYMVTRGSKIIGWCQTETEGKAIADKDNEARILAALEQKRCGKCNGRGYIQWHPSWDNGNDPCDACNGKGSA